MFTLEMDPNLFQCGCCDVGQAISGGYGYWVFMILAEALLLLMISGKVFESSQGSVSMRWRDRNLAALFKSSDGSQPF